MELADLGGVKLILLAVIACGTAIGFMAFLLARRRQNDPAPPDTSLRQAPAPERPNGGSRRQLQPDNRARAVAFVNEVTTASRRDRMS